MHVLRPYFLFGCVSVGVNVIETFQLLPDWRHSASPLWPELSDPLCSAWIPPRHRRWACAFTPCVCVYFSVRTHACVCVWAPVSVASDANQSWSLVTVLQQGDLRFDGADKHMMWLYISKVSTACTHHAKSMSLLSLALSSREKITVVLHRTCFDINRVLKTDANSFVVQLLSARLYYCSQERASIFIAIQSIGPVLTSLYF